MELVSDVPGVALIDASLALFVGLAHTGVAVNAAAIAAANRVFFIWNTPLADDGCDHSTMLDPPSHSSATAMPNS